MKQNNAKKSGGNDFKAKIAHKSFAKKKEIINPFDKFSNAKKKHEVLNRRVKGEDRNVGRAREKAIDERKNKLLKDYHNSKKSSSFLDKRFGESDANLSLEEKMFMRFQQERVKKVRNGSLFNLDANDTEVLTHKGQQLGSSNMDDRDWVSSDEEGGGKLDKEVVNKLHFGGGMVETKRSSEGIYGPSNDEEEYGGPRKGRLEALQEIVMKSKLHKMQRKEAKEEQEDEREKLDKAFEDLFATSQIDITRPEKGRRSRDRDDLGDLDDMDAYDVSLREMAFEAKVQPSDRTKTEEEIAVETREKIEELEKARLKRMRQVALPEDKEADGALRPGSGGRRVKHITDDMIDEPVSRKSAKAAAPVSDDEGEDGDSEEGGEDEEYSEEGDSDEEEEGEEEEEEEEEEGSDEEMDYDAQPDEEKEGSEEGSDEEDSEDDEATKRGNRNRRGGKAVTKKQMYVDDGVNLSMPHKISCPVDLESFDELVAQHVRSDVDMNALISRILAWNSVHLPGAQGAENKNLMHNFLDVLLKHFVRVGDSLGSDKNDEDSVLSQLDFLCGTIFTLSEQVGDSCAALWGRTLKILQSQLQKRLRDYSQGNRESCWPSLGRLLLLQLLGHVFSVTDLKNEIVGPAALFLCQCIAQCPVSNAKELSSGLLACNILLTYTAETKRFVPEILTFAHSTVAAFLPDLISDRKQFQSTFNSSSLAWLRLSASQGQASSSEGDHRISWVSFGSSSSSKSPATASSLLHSTYMLIGAVLSQYEHSSAVSELFDPILSTLRALNPQSAPVLSNYLQKQHVDLLEKILSVCLNRSTERVPLQWRKAVTVSIDMKTPRFQLDYTFKKDTDPDEDRVKLKQLNRQFKREKKAAMRELRRDSDYIDQERFKEVTAAHEKRREERVRNYGWMEEQQATVNMQVRQGKGLMKGGGSNVAKKARVKRM